MDLGATPMQALTRVIVPQIRPGIVSGALIAFTMSFDDFFTDLEILMDEEPMPIHSEEEQRKMAFQRASEEYSRKFDEAYQAREIRRASERAQWQNLILPMIRQAGITRRRDAEWMTA